MNALDLAYRLTDRLGPMTRARWILRLFGTFIAPLIGYIRPRVEALDDKRCVVMVPLRRRTRNRMFDGMYVGVFGIGADIVGGALAQHWIRQQPGRLSMIVKDLEIDLLRRAESDVRFVSADSARIGELVDRAVATGERHHATIGVDAFTGAAGEQTLVARMKISMSVKVVD